jgi:hypothetical protein
VAHLRHRSGVTVAILGTYLRNADARTRHIGLDATYRPDRWGASRSTTEEETTYGAKPREGGMPCPVVKILGKKIILLNGYHNNPRTKFTKNSVKPSKIDGIRNLRQCAKRHPDAVAFGFVAGRWVPAA